MKTLLLHEIGHTAIYLLLAILLTKLLKYKKYPVKLIIVGYLITIGLDADHLLDYLIVKSFNGFNLNEFFFGSYMITAQKIYVLLHAWEWAILMVLLYFLFHEKYNFFLFVAIAIAAQLIFDTISYGFDWQSYFIVFRAHHNFSKHVFHSSYY